MEKTGFQLLALIYARSPVPNRLETSCAWHPISAKASDFATRQGQVYGFSQRKLKLQIPARNRFDHLR
jgi:hypothetical protein